METVLRVYTLYFTTSASLIILTLTLISLSVVSDTKTFDNEKLEQLKIYLDEKNYDWEEISNQ
jgi:hypothetical protein